MLIQSEHVALFERQFKYIISALGNSSNHLGQKDLDNMPYIPGALG